jgi:ribonuclease P/MRP protein subunit POP1
MDERHRRKEEWDRRPRGKRIEFESLDLGAGRKGEIGLGWACDFETLRKSVSVDKEHGGSAVIVNNLTTNEAKSNLPPPHFQHLLSTTINSISNPQLDIPAASLATIRITLFSRGVPLACARIYRLPQHPPRSDTQDSTSTRTTNEATPKSNTSQTKNTTAASISSIRDQWLAFVPLTNSPRPKLTPKPPPPLSTLPPGAPRHRALAQTLLQTPPLPYPSTPKTPLSSHPMVPNEDDLIGFVTTGNFNLAEGKGTAFGSVVVEKVLEGLKARGREDGKGGGKGGGGLRRQERMCIVRNAGESVGRLGIWELV